MILEETTTPVSAVQIAEQIAAAEAARKAPTSTPARARTASSASVKPPPVATTPATPASKPPTLATTPATPRSASAASLPRIPRSSTPRARRPAETTTSAGENAEARIRRAEQENARLLKELQDSQAREAAARSAQAREEERSKAAAERERARLEAERKARVQPAIDAAEEAARQARQNSSTTGEEDEAARLAWALRQSRLPPELQDQRYINVDDVPEDQDEEIFDQDWEESAIDPPAIHQRYKAEVEALRQRILRDASRALQQAPGVEKKDDNETAPDNGLIYVGENRDQNAFLKR